MTGILLCTCSCICQADKSCVGLPRFQARLDAARDSRRPRIHKRAEACANHLGVMIVAMTTWAHEQDLTDAELTVLTIEPPAWESHPRQQCQHCDCVQTSGLVFSVIHLGRPESAPAGQCLGVSDAVGSGSSVRPGPARRLSASVPRVTDYQQNADTCRWSPDSGDY